MKQYPDEQQVIEEVLSAYRSAIKYQDIFGQLQAIYSIAHQMGRNPKGDYITAAEEIADQLEGINSQMERTIDDYDPLYLNNAIENAKTIAKLDYMSDDPSKLFNGLAMSIWMLLKKHDYFNAPRLAFYIKNMNKNEESQVIKSAIKFYRTAVKEYAVLGNINEVLQSMIDDLVAYTCDPVPVDWQSLALKLYNDLSILEKAAQDNGVTNASVLSPLSSAGQIARNLTKLNKSEPTQKLQHYYEAIRNNLCDALKNISPDPKVRTQKSMFSGLKELCFDVRKALYSINSLNDMMSVVNSMTLLKDAFDRSPIKDGKSVNLIHRADNNILLIGDVIKDIQSGEITFAQGERAVMAYRDNADDLLRQFEISYVKSIKTVNQSQTITQKAGVNYSRLIRFDTDSVQYIATTLYNVLHNHANISLGEVNELHELLDGIYAAFEVYKAPDGRSYFDINPRFRTAMEKGLQALRNPEAHGLEDAYNAISNIINVYDNKPIQ